MNRHPLSTDEEDEIFQEIGRFVVCFQILENQLFQTCWLLGGHEGADRRWLAGLGYSRLVSVTGERVHELLRHKEKAGSSFAESYCDLLCRCRKLAERRNGIVHSAYVYMEAGGEVMGVIRSDMTKGRSGDDAEFDYEAVTVSFLQKSIRELADTGVGLSLARAQLIHWL